MKGLDSDFKKASDITVKIDGEKLEVNDYAVYDQHCGISSDATAIAFPVELTKSGYTDTFLLEISGKLSDNKTITETAKISLRLENTSEYKNAKTATISKIESTNRQVLDAYIVGSRSTWTSSTSMKRWKTPLKSPSRTTMAICSTL